MAVKDCPRNDGVCLINKAPTLERVMKCWWLAQEEEGAAAAMSLCTDLKQELRISQGCSQFHSDWLKWVRNVSWSPAGLWGAQTLFPCPKESCSSPLSAGITFPASLARSCCCLHWAVWCLFDVTRVEQFVIRLWEVTIEGWRCWSSLVMVVFPLQINKSVCGSWRKKSVLLLYFPYFVRITFVAVPNASL